MFEDERYSPDKWHMDTVVKVPLLGDDKMFLQALQKELNEQPTFGNADPRYFMIRGSERVYGIEDGDPCVSFGSWDRDPLFTMEEAAEFCTEVLRDHYKEDSCEAKHCSGNYIDIYIDGDQTETLFTMEDVAEFLNRYKYECRATTYEDMKHTYPGTLFLTFAAACRHLKENHYHYAKDARPYTYTAWRSPEIERLLAIIRTVDWEHVTMQED